MATLSSIEPVYQTTDVSNCCSKCEEMIGTATGLRALLSEEGYEHYRVKKIWQIRKGQDESAQCPLCYFVQNGRRSAGSQATKTVIRVSGETIDQAARPDHRATIDHPLQDRQLVNLKFRPGMGHIFHESLPLYARAGSPTAQFVHSRVASTDLSSEMIQRSRQWLNNYKHRHNNCPQYHTPDLPRRVIYVGQEGESCVRLHESEIGEKSDYAALSYCWGGDQPMKTTRSNFETYKRSLPLGQLPKTIMDAIKLTQQLGLKFLWCDVISIIQDLEEDMLQQIPEMASVYKNSLVTLVATGAKSVSEGFVSNVDNVAYGGRLPIYLGNDSSDVLPSTAKKTGIAFCDRKEISRTSSDRTRSPLAKKDEPLYSRGWAFQEIMLSPRKLILTPYVAMLCIQ